MNKRSHGSGFRDVLTQTMATLTDCCSASLNLGATCYVARVSGTRSKAEESTGRAETGRGQGVVWMLCVPLGSSRQACGQPL